jgi:hypothetical protein
LPKTRRFVELMCVGQQLNGFHSGRAYSQFRE